MPKMTFTTRGVEALKPSTRPVDYWSDDPTERGFGIRVQPSGSRSWFVWTRKTKTGKPAMVTLGTFSATFGLAKARKEAEKKRADVQHGENPAEERREERQAQRQTVQALFDSYATHVELRRQAGEFKSWPDVKRSFERDVLPVIAFAVTRSVTSLRRISRTGRSPHLGRTSRSKARFTSGQDLNSPACRRSSTCVA